MPDDRHNTLTLMSFMYRRPLREETRAAAAGAGEAWSSTAEPPDAALFAQTPGEGLPARGAEWPRHSHPQPSIWPSADQGPCERVSGRILFLYFYWLETNSGNPLLKNKPSSFLYVWFKGQRKMRGFLRLQFRDFFWREFGNKSRLLLVSHPCHFCHCV